MLMNLQGYTPLAPDEASCVIAHLFTQLSPPCAACKKHGIITIQGTTFDGNGAKIEIQGEEVRYYGKQSTLDAIRQGQFTRRKL